MWRHKLLLAGLCCSALAVALLAFFALDDEPRYHGRNLSKWLRTYWDNAMTQDSPEFEESAKAVRAIGTNALPFLLKWIRHEAPPWQGSARNSLPEALSQNSLPKLAINGPGDDTAKAAMLGFGILGTNAAPAIPELTAMMKDTANPRTARRAIVALSSLGARAFPHMVSALSDTNHPYRWMVANSLATFMAPNVGTNICIPPLIAALSDPDLQTRSAASRMLSRLAPDALTNAPTPNP